MDFPRGTMTTSPAIPVSRNDRQGQLKTRSCVVMIEILMVIIRIVVMMMIKIIMVMIRKCQDHVDRFRTPEVLGLTKQLLEW